MSDAQNSQLILEAVAANRWVDALRLVFSGARGEELDCRVDRIIQLHRAGEISLNGLFELRRGDCMVAASLAQVQEGRTATVSPPRTFPMDRDDFAQMLYEAIDGLLINENVRLAQVLVTTDASQDARRLITAGYRHSVDLMYLVSPRHQFPEAQPTTEINFESFSEQQRSRLERIIGLTYQKTLDCPSLNGLRQIHDVLEGYRTTGVYSPNRWFFLTSEGLDIGCLLLSDHPAEDQWEVVYLGLIPEVRGRNWGLAATRMAQWKTGQAGRCRLVLAVDSLNLPAISIYAAAGFEMWDRRSIFLKWFGSSEAV